MTEPTRVLPDADRPRKRRGLRWIIALVVLAGLLITADRVGAAVTENMLAGRIQQNENLSRKPDVAIGGFPFLTQVASRRFEHVTVDMNGLVANGVPISELHADLTGVHVSSGYNSATADTVNATAVLDDASLSSVLSERAGIGEVRVGQGDNGSLKATYQLLTLSASAEVAVTLEAGNVIDLKAVKITGPTGLGLVTGNGFDVKISLANLPFGMRISSIQVLPNQVRVQAVGHDVALNGGHTG